ncbi:hypothetical protein AB0G32_34650, partial [Streptomyces sp. NPDC023723]
MPQVPPPFDPEVAAVLDAAPADFGPGLALRDLPARRAQARELAAVLDPTLDGAFEAAERLVPGPPGAPDVPLLVCRPAGPAAAPRPVLYHPRRAPSPAATRRRPTRAATLSSA